MTEQLISDEGQEKKPYKEPKLTVHGDINKLTQSMDTGPGDVPYGSISA